MSALDGYWAAYDATLARVRSERPSTFAELKAILDEFHHGALQDGGAQAFFPSQSADEELFDALMDIGWRINFIEGGYVYEARNLLGVLQFEFVEGDLYDRSDPGANARAAAVDAVNVAFGAKPGGTPRFTAEAEGDDYLFGSPRSLPGAGS